MKPENPSRIKWLISIVCIASILSLILSVTAVCRSYCRSENLGIDYLGIIVGVLAILVTCLVAWNIYTIIDMKSEVKKMQDKQKSFVDAMEEKEKDITKNVFNTQARIYDTAVSFEEQILNPRKERFSTGILIDMISTIDLLSRANKYEEADIKLQYYTITIQENANAIKNGFVKEMKRDVFGLLYAIPNRKQLPSFEKFEKQVIDVIDMS